jgi:hypothetical protein
MKYLLLLALLLGGCANESETRRTLMRAGYSNVQITGWKAFECGHDDTWATGFRARTDSGRIVTGTVCCGLVFKGCTVRF